MTLDDFGRVWTMFCRNCDFPWYIRQFYEKVVILLHTFENYVFGASEFDTPIEDQKWSGRFVERFRGSDRESSIGVQAWESIDFWRKVMILHNTFINFLKKWWFHCIHSKILLLEPQNSTPLSRIRNGVVISSTEFEYQITNHPRW